jgi:hypothetical protein
MIFVTMYWAKSKYDPSIHSCALHGTDQQLLAGVPRKCLHTAALAAFMKSIVNTIYVLSCILRRVFAVFCAGLRPYVSINIMLLLRNRSFNFDIMFTFLGTSVIFLISKTCIWSSVIKN